MIKIGDCASLLEDYDFAAYCIGSDLTKRAILLKAQDRSDALVAREKRERAQEDQEMER